MMDDLDILTELLKASSSTTSIYQFNTNVRTPKVKLDISVGSLKHDNKYNSY